MNGAETRVAILEYYYQANVSATLKPNCEHTSNQLNQLKMKIDLDFRLAARAAI